MGNRLGVSQQSGMGRHASMGTTSVPQPAIAITVGDIYGIGPEVILKSLASEDGTAFQAVVIGPDWVFDAEADNLGMPWNPTVVRSIEQLQQRLREPARNTPAAPILFVPPSMASARDLGKAPKPPTHRGLRQATAESGRIAMQAVDAAIELCLAGTAHAMVTAPLSKHAIALAGYTIPGHTGYLAKQCGIDSDDVLMTLMSGTLRVALVTEHIPISLVSSRITGDRILKKLTLLHQSLQNDHGIASPSIAVLGLNPHAGDEGQIGREEIDIIVPALREAAKKGIAVSGPHPADGFFGMKQHKSYDAVLAMYHDQGLGPFKALSFGSGVNVTAGLPFVRTSPDHGTAFDIAGKGQARPDSMRAALALAITCYRQREQSHQPEKTHG